MDDLKHATLDKEVWNGLKLPMRLKVELKKALGLCNLHQLDANFENISDEGSDFRRSPYAHSISTFDSHESPHASMKDSYIHDNRNDNRRGVAEIGDKITDQVWIKVWSSADNDYYYFNSETYISQWQCPDSSKDYDTYETNPYWQGNLYIQAECHVLTFPP